MPNRVTYNNFSAGIISPYLRRMVNSEIYNQSASKMENVYPMVTGGFRLRDGMKHICSLDEYNIKRIVPFCISEKEYYLIGLAEKKLYVIAFNGEEVIFSDPYTTEYLESELDDICFSQNYEMLVFAHGNHPPFILRRSIVDENILFNAENIKLDDLTVKYEQDKVEANKFNYEGLFTTKDFPSVVCFMSGRLWFANSKEHPYRLWASRPFKYNNFQDVESYKTIDDTSTVEEMLDSITNDGKTVKYASSYTYQYDGSKIVDIQIYGETDIEDDGAYRLDTEVSTSTSGYRVTVKSLYSKTAIEGEVTTGKQYYWTFVKSITKAVNINVEKIVWNETTTDDCAIVREVGSDRNDSIQWIQSSNDIYVGTSSSEYLIPKESTANNISITKIASFGAAEKVQPCVGNNNVYYVNSGYKNIRTIKYGYYGPEYANVTQYCTNIFENKIKSLHWQRVIEPRMYALLNDGTCAILCDSGNGNVSAWSHISTKDGEIKSIAIVDNKEGQEVYLICLRKGSYYLEKFEKGLFSDGINKVSIDAEVISNSVNQTGTVSLFKGAVNYYVDSFGTAFMIAQDGVDVFEEKQQSNDELFKVNVYGKNTYDLRFRIKNLKNRDFIILAIESVVEVM